jgi:hypothetical protein
MPPSRAVRIEESSKYSAIWLCDGTANITFCGWSCPGFARGPAIGAGRSARRRRQAGWVQDVCPSQTD